jgi:hypothetical protein
LRISPIGVQRKLFRGLNVANYEFLKVSRDKGANNLIVTSSSLQHHGTTPFTARTNESTRLTNRSDGVASRGRARCQHVLIKVNKYDDVATSYSTPYRLGSYHNPREWRKRIRGGAYLAHIAPQLRCNVTRECRHSHSHSTKTGRSTVPTKTGSPIVVLATTQLVTNFCFSLSTQRATRQLTAANTRQ